MSENPLMARLVGRRFDCWTLQVHGLAQHSTCDSGKPLRDVDGEGRLSVVFAPKQQMILCEKNVDRGPTAVLTCPPIKIFL